jgi:hypothetical protein
MDEVTYLKFKRDAEQRAKELSNTYSIHSDVLYRLDKLRDRFIDPTNFENLAKVVEAAEGSIPGMYDIQMTFTPSFRMFQNEYGYNMALYGEEFDKFKVAGSLMSGGLGRGKPIKLIIRYPEFTITNSNGNSQVIRDLFVRFTIYLGSSTPSSFTMFGPEGIRLRVSAKEFMSKYAHSHLHSKDHRTMFEWDHFCTGVGDINAAIALANDTNEHPLDVELLKLVLFEVEPLVTWESIEGTPYMRMSNNHESGESIVSADSVVINQANSENRQIVIRTVKEYIRSTNYIPDLDWNLINGGGEIIPNEKWDNFFTTIFPVEQWYQYYYVVNINGNVVTKLESPMKPEHIGVWDDRFIYFKGQKVYFMADPPETQTTVELDETVKYFNPKLKDHVKQYLESIIFSTKVRQNAVERLQGSYRAIR